WCVLPEMQVNWDPHHSPGVMMGPNAVGPNNEQGQAPMYTTFIPQVVPMSQAIQYQGQTEDGLFYRIRQEAEELVRTFASSFMNLSYIRTFSNILELDEKNEPQYLPLRQVYLGMEAHNSMALLSCDRCVKQTELDLVYRAARDFYVEAIAQIKARFKFEDPIFEFTKVLDPKVAREDPGRKVSPPLGT
ncbi:hypothetical protein QYM36_016379, partial [Artemia franciscana]